MVAAVNNKTFSAHQGENARQLRAFIREVLKMEKKIECAFVAVRKVEKCGGNS